MKTINFHKILLTILLIVLAKSFVWAGNNKFADDKTISLVAENLSASLKNELAEENLTLEFKRVQKKMISKNEMLLTGNVFCVIKKENTQLPISFEAKVNMSKQAVEEVVYEFLENELVPVYDEDILMKNLLKQIRSDYKTDNIIIALDGFEASETLYSQKEFKGLAEVRIGDVEWKRIDFDVLMTRDNVPVKIVYSVQK